MTDLYSQNRCVCSTRYHGPLLCAFCLSFHFKYISEKSCVLVLLLKYITKVLRFSSTFQVHLSTLGFSTIIVSYYKTGQLG